MMGHHCITGPTFTSGLTYNSQTSGPDTTTYGVAAAVTRPHPLRLLPLNAVHQDDGLLEEDQRCSSALEIYCQSMC